MKNFVQEAGNGDAAKFTAPTGGVVSGGVYQIGQLLVVATVTADEAALFSGIPMVGGSIYKVTKVGSQAWTEGLIVYYDKENARFTSTATGSLRAGWAVLGAGSAMPGSGAGETTGYILAGATPVADEA